MNIESSQMNQDVLKGLQIGNESLKKLNSIMSIEAVEALLDETADAIEQQREIDALLAGGASSSLDDELENELVGLIAESGVKSAEVQAATAPAAGGVSVATGTNQPLPTKTHDDLLDDLAQISAPNHAVAQQDAILISAPHAVSDLDELESLSAPSHKVVVSESLDVELAD